MEIKLSGSQPSAKGPAEFFTGNVRIDPLFPATDPSCVSAGLVTFEPGARTAWHTHPLGQRLIVLPPVAAGCSVGAGPRGKSAPATSSFARLAKSIGTAEPQPPV